MKLSDYVMDFLSSKLGIRDVFMLVGGANAHLVDSLAKRGDMKFICCQHEQAVAMAADAYARTSGRIGAALVTSGPGGTNALTGLCCSWCDSVPCIFLSGQVGLHLTTDGTTVRQLGVQQINIADLVRPVTKYAVMLRDPREVRFHLEKAAYLATHGRPGPVWIDVPTNFQHADVDPDELRGFGPDPVPQAGGDATDYGSIVSLLAAAERPVVIGGHGIRIAKGEREFLELVERLGFPALTTWNAADLIPAEHPLYAGHAGVFGDRGANFAVANSDCILAIGSRLDTRQVGDLPRSFGRAAKKIVVDIDRHELEKGLISIDVPVVEDAKVFVETLAARLQAFTPRLEVARWAERCRDLRLKYPVTVPEYFRETRGVNSYVFTEALSRMLEEGDIIVTDMGTSLTCTMQTFRAKPGQRLFTNTGFAPMGYGLPGAIGAWFASRAPRVICVTGDGGLQMNIQEFQTVVHHKVPVKLFVLNNRAYLTIKHTQDIFFGGRVVGAHPASGYSAPDFVAVARAYGIPAWHMSYHDELETKIGEALKDPGPALVEIRMPDDQPLLPRTMFRYKDGRYIPNPIERMSPELSEKEFLSNMLIPPDGET